MNATRTLRTTYIHRSLDRLSRLSVALGVLLVLASAVFRPGGAFASAAQGSQKWVLDVGTKFQPSEVQAAGGTLEWYWQEAGIAVAASADPTFGNKVLGRNVSLAVADMTARGPSLLSMPQTEGSPSDPIDFDAYASNYQWYWQAIGAARPNPQGGPPLWQLGDYEGSGVKVADIDSGVPAIWDSGVWGNGHPVDLHPEFNEYDPSHPELGGVVVLRDPNTGDVLNYDDYGHGTLVVSMLAAQHRGPGAMRGLVPKATVYCHRLDWYNFYSSFLEGWFKAAEFGCQILNNSLAAIDLPVERYGDINYKFPIIIRKAATELHRRGVLIVAAAGNYPVDLKKDSATFFPWVDWGLDHGLHAVFSEPQDMPNVIVAGGTGPADYDPFAADGLSKYDPWPGSQKGRAFNLDRIVNCHLADWWWPGSWPRFFGSDYGHSQTVVAPMGMNFKDWTVPLANIRYQTIYFANCLEVVPGQGFHDYGGGTSLSSPITCGVAVLAAEAYYRVHGVMPSPVTLASILKASADDLVGPATDDFWVWNEKTLQFEFKMNMPADKPGNDTRYGYGRVNALKAIEMARR